MASWRTSICCDVRRFVNSFNNSIKLLAACQCERVRIVLKRILLLIWPLAGRMHLDTEDHQSSYQHRAQWATIPPTAEHFQNVRSRCRLAGKHERRSQRPDSGQPPGLPVAALAGPNRPWHAAPGRAANMTRQLKQQLQRSLTVCSLFVSWCKGRGNGNGVKRVAYGRFKQCSPNTILN